MGHHSRKSAVRPRFDGTPTLGRRVANPPQDTILDTILPHKAPAFIPSPCAAAAHREQVSNLPTNAAHTQLFSGFITATYPRFR